MNDAITHTKSTQASVARARAVPPLLSPSPAKLPSTPFAFSRAVSFCQGFDHIRFDHSGRTVCPPTPVIWRTGCADGSGAQGFTPHWSLLGTPIHPCKMTGVTSHTVLYSQTPRGLTILVKLVNTRRRLEGGAPRWEDRVRRRIRVLFRTLR